MSLSENTLMLMKGTVYLPIPIMIIAYVLYFYSHYLLAKAKGYGGWLALFALINTFGILILFLLPDRRKTG